MRKWKKTQGLTAVTLTVALGAAVYLNWDYSRREPETIETATSVSQTEAVPISDPLISTGEEVTGDKNYGEAQLVSVNQDSGDSFFEQARAERTKSRDTALDTLKKSLKSTGLSSEEKSELTAQLKNEIEHITTESEIEALIKAKGFVDSVVYLDDNKVHVTVMTENDGLSKGEVAQIRDIILSKCSVDAQNISVVEVK